MNKSLIHPEADPQQGNLLTPVSRSSWSQQWIRNLPIYRQGLAANRRGLEIGMAHGYFLYGPFAVLGPLRNSSHREFAAVLSAASLVAILTVALTLYGQVRQPERAATSEMLPMPQDLCNAGGWNAFASSFLLGGLGGAVVAFLFNLGLKYLGLRF